MIYSKKILLTVMIVLWYFFPGKAAEWKTGAPSTSLTWSNVATSRLIELHFTHSGKSHQTFHEEGSLENYNNWIENAEEGVFIYI